MASTTPGPARSHASPTATGVPWHLWLVGTLGLLWNSVGAFDYVMTQTRHASSMRRFSPAQIESLHSFPSWLVGCWALAVWGGVLGAVLLLLKRRLAAPVLLASLLALGGTAIHNAISANGLYATGGTDQTFVLLIFSIALGLWWYARAMEQRSVLA